MALALKRAGVGLSLANLAAASSAGALLPKLPGLSGWLSGWLKPADSAAPVDTPYDEHGLVLAAPKKKVSYRRRRQRQLSASKAVQPVKNLVRCPACGHIKRSHTLCMNCVKEIQKAWRIRDAPSKSEEAYTEEGMDPTDLRIMYPGRRETSHRKDLKKRHEYLWSRPPTLEARDLDPSDRLEEKYNASAAKVGLKPMPMLLKKPWFKKD